MSPGRFGVSIELFGMEVIRTEIEGVLLLRPDVYRDSRGYFCETFSARRFRELTGVDTEFVQDNEARSVYGVLRGLHYQKGEHSQAKLVRVSEGRVLDVVVDIRPDSPSYGRHVAVELSSDNFLQLYIPRGFAHGYAVLSDTVVFQYKTDRYYCPESEGAILWNDPSLGIDWLLPEEDIILSEKDRINPLFGVV